MSGAIKRLAASPLLLFLPAAAVSLLVYLGIGAAGGVVGFPLDDAWIHQTYARNLGLHGEFAFVPGQPSAGSTSTGGTIVLASRLALVTSRVPWTGTRRRRVPSRFLRPAACAAADTNVTDSSGAAVPWPDQWAP